MYKTLIATFILGWMSTPVFANEAVALDSLVEKNGIFYQGNAPFSGTAFIENEEAKKELNYKDGLLHGQYIERHSNGIKSFEASFKEGKRDGTITTWYKNGQKSSEMLYENGYPKGTMSAWYENGQIQLKGSLTKNEIQNGEWTFWYENGQKQLQQTVRFGKIEGAASRWYKNGVKKDDLFYADGKIVSVVVWKPNGVKCTVTNLQGGNGTWVRYKEDGTEDWRSIYRDGLYVLE